MPLPGGEKGLTVCAFVTDRRKDRTDKEISPAKMIYITCEGMGPRHLDNSRQDARGYLSDIIVEFVTGYIRDTLNIGGIKQ